MSIPSINFKANPIKRGTVQTSVTRERPVSIPRRTPAHVLFSSDSESDDLPCISTQLKVAEPPIRVPTPSECNWAAQPRCQENCQIQIERRAPQKSDSDDSDPRAHKKRKFVPMPPPSIRPPPQNSFVLIREAKKMMKKGGADYRLMDHDNVVYFGRKLHDEDGFAISDSQIILAVVQKQAKGKRAAVIDRRLQKPFDDRPPEILGMAFVHLPETKSKTRTFRVTLPKSGVNFPMTESRELARIAESATSDSQIHMYTNKPPSITAQGTLTNPFGNVYLVESIKNFAVFDENDNLVFMIYKVAEGTFTMKERSPFTPLTAFALGLAIITH
jgi:hypothetical protein